MVRYIYLARAIKFILEDDSVSSFAPSVPVASPNGIVETELSTTGAVATRQSVIDRYLQETA